MAQQERSLAVETLVVNRITLNRDTAPGATLGIGLATTAEAMTASGATAISGALTVTGAVTTTALQYPSTAGPTSGALTAAMSGRLCLGTADANFDLPAVTGNAGVWYTIIVATVGASAGLTITALTAVIQGKTLNAGATAITNATIIRNTQATNVVGDQVTIRCDGAKWWVLNQSGTWAAV